MALTELIPAGGAALGVVLGAGGLMWMRSRGTGVRPQTVAGIAAVAPAELRTAVSILADPPQTNMMLAALDLGSPDSGFPYVECWDYDAHGLYADVLMLGGQKFKDWNNEDVRAQFATYLGVAEVTVSSPAPSWVRLQVRVYDTLAAPATTPVAVADDVDLEAVPVGITEDGEVWTIPVQGRHILMGGRTGSGKSGVLQALIHALAPAIASGRVDLRVIDPKGGMELGFLEPLCTRFECTMPESMIGMLEETVTDMQEAARKYRGKTRKPVPTPENPLTIIIIDEAATLSAFSDQKLRARFERAHGLLLSQGRAPLFSVIETVIDPSKETVPQRQLFPYRIGLGMDEPTQVAMIHGASARDRGSRCDEIPATTPGVCYVQEDGKTGVTRVRAYLVTDEDIDAIVAAYAPNKVATAPQGDYSDFDPDDLGDEDGEVAA
ncbi:FtsK/SpoIIIE domain-containing protein [Nocardia ninae]|uniref:FtsK domain-containing protein n=1 Tax=Nocardia ninae NBRC 108245 TaxID=1210091 RepID=A0A511MLL8_9NOCA|nr:FtsK/SpoIIIE domain-containing protein [Nocardia ninae]GEM41525.1 hypothetical protein NN4_60440 [Nocardia ninae NBRC 108245]